jgi:hypothetical protein
MSQDKSAGAALEAASVKSLAQQLYGLALEDARAARIAAELTQLEAGAKAAGALTVDTAPGVLFRQLLLAHDPMAARRA